VPRQQVVDGLDSGRAGSTLYHTEPKYVFLARTALDNARDKIIMVGASNVVVGFRQAQLQRLLPGPQVHNLAVGGSNMTQVREIVNLVQEAQSPDARRHNTFVIGLWYGLFADDATRWNTPDRHPGDTDIDIERYRYGFYRRGESGPVPLLPARYLDQGTTLIHPYLVIDSWTRALTARLRQQAAGKPAPITDAQRNAVVLNEAQKKHYLDFWADYMGHKAIGNEQFDALRKLIDDVTLNGGKVILADLPIPDWHAKQSPWHAQYEQRKSQLFASLAGRPDVATVSLQGVSAGENFSDEVHPKPKVAIRWAEQLAGALRVGEKSTTLTQNTVPVTPTR
jgi:hypothetical protein